MTSLTRKLTALTESHRECAALITQLGNTNLHKTHGAKRHGQPDLATQVHNLLKSLEQDAEFLELEIADEADADLRQNLQSKFKTIQDSIRRSRLHYRKAQLASKRATDQSHRLERELVYSSRTSHHTPTDAQTADEVVLSAASDVTLSLRRTHALLSNSLQQSHFTRETLNASTQALKELGTRYSRVDEIMLSSRKLVVDLIRKNKSDSWYYEKAIWILAGTLAWLIFRRFMWGPLWLFVWMPMKSTYWILGNVKGLFMGAGIADVQGIDVLSREMGLPAVPTMVIDNTDGRVHEKVKEVAKDQDSMVEQVGRIIDGQRLQHQWQAVEEVAEEPNPLKRVHEEPAEPEEQPNPKKRVVEEQYGQEPEPVPVPVAKPRANSKSRAWEEPERKPEPVPVDEQPPSHAYEAPEPEAPEYPEDEEDIPNPLKRVWEEPDVEPQSESIPEPEIEQPQVVPETPKFVDEGYASGTDEEEEAAYEKAPPVVHDTRPTAGRVGREHDEL